MADIDLSLLPEFLVEATEHIEEMEGLLLKLEQGSVEGSIFDDIFRTAHSLKGGAQYLGLENISQLTHRFEDLLDRLREDKKKPTQTVIDLLIEGRDRLAKLITELGEVQEEQSSVEDLLLRFEQQSAPGSDVSPSVAQTPAALPSTLPTFDGLPAIEEESDAELFNVFIENLSGKYDLLRKISGELAFATERSKLYADSTAYLENLKSAAMYMGYEELGSFFQTWLADIAGAPAEGEIAETLMDKRLDWLASQFSQLNAARSEAESVGAEDVSSAVMAAFESEDESAVEFDITSSASVDDIITEDVDDDDDEEADIDYSLLPDFLVESTEHLEELEALLLQLENAGDNTDALNSIFRSIHTIKGSSQFIGLQRVSKLSHRMEDLLDLLRAGKKAATTSIVDMLITGKDRLAVLFKELESNRIEESQVNDLVARLTREIGGIGGDESTQIKVAEQSPEVSIDLDTSLSAENPIVRDTGIMDMAAFKEDYDQELFDIFLQHIKEQLGEIQSAETLEPTERLDNYLQSVNRLQSSASYMGYEELSQFYNDWLEEINKVQSTQAEGSHVAFDFMNHYLGLLVETFPQVAEAISGTSFAELEARIENSQEVPASSEKQAVLDITSAARPEPGETVTKEGEEDALVEKLSQALDMSMNDPSGAGHQTLHEVFDEMLSTGKGEDKRNELRKELQPTAVEEVAAVAETPVVEEKKYKGKEHRNKGRRLSDDRRQEDKRVLDRRTTEPSAGEKITKKSVRVDAEKIDTLMNQVGELVVDRSYFFQLFNEMRDLQVYLKENASVDARDLKQIRGFHFKLGEAIASLNRTSNELQEGVMKVRMLPIAQLFNRYPRLVHDLTRKSNKKVNLKVEGESTELDKMIVEELSDPLIHIIRNSIDHGIETVEERVVAGKPEEGTLTLKAYQESNHIVIEVLDDGRGIDTKRVKEKALEKGLHTADELNRMSEKELIWLIMSAGFSTASQISDTSGRGVGMDVVRKNIEKLNGVLEVDTIPGKETRVRLKIPLTLAIIPALQIRVGDDLFTIPLANVEETLIIKGSETSIIEGTEVIQLRGHTLPIFRLSTLFDIASKSELTDETFVVVVSSGMQQIGLVVDELKGQSEVVIKPLVDYLQEKSGFSGATIIGDGRISLILDVYELANMTASSQAKKQRQRSLKMKRDAAAPASQV